MSYTSKKERSMIEEMLLKGRNYKLINEIRECNHDFYLITKGQEIVCYFGNCEDAVQRFYELEGV